MDTTHQFSTARLTRQQKHRRQRPLINASLAQFNSASDTLTALSPVAMATMALGLLLWTRTASLVALTMVFFASCHLIMFSCCKKKKKKKDKKKDKTTEKTQGTPAAAPPPPPPPPKPAAVAATAPPPSQAQPGKPAAAPNVAAAAAPAKAPAPPAVPAAAKAAPAVAAVQKPPAPAAATPVQAAPSQTQYGQFGEIPQELMTRCPLAQAAPKPAPPPPKPPSLKTPPPKPPQPASGPRVSFGGGVSMIEGGRAKASLDSGGGSGQKSSQKSLIKNLDNIPTSLLEPVPTPGVKTAAIVEEPKPSTGTKDKGLVTAAVLDKGAKTAAILSKKGEEKKKEEEKKAEGPPPPKQDDTYDNLPTM